ncbi:MAG: glycosyltransferase [Rivularia sp. (in: cyanobacteria)]
MKARIYSRGYLLLLLVWLVIGIGLRLSNLSGKSPWTDEFSTLVFSLGNSFLGVPLDKAITIDTLLQPLQPNSAAGIGDVLSNLLNESNHPPLYFTLTHLWLKLFPTSEGLVSVWGARLLAAIFGGLSIPAIFGLSWLTFRSRLISHFAAAMMAVSPFAIFLAQEARHYTLAILWAIASLACLVITLRHIKNRTQLPVSIALAWVIINALGIATHYFFALTLCGEVFVLMFMVWREWKDKDAIVKGRTFNLISSPWKRIYAVAFGTFVAGVVWLPIFINNSYGNELTDWIQGERVGFAWISPIFQAMAAWITMISLLPVEAPQLPVVIASGLVMLIFFIWFTPILIRAYKIQLSSPQTKLMTQALSSLILGAIILFFIFTYFLGIDLTRGARYNFVYFPAVIVLLGAILAAIWDSKNQEKLKWGVTGKQAVGIVLLMGCISSITVICNLGYQKYYRPDIFVKLIEKTSTSPVLIATTQKTHVQIGEMMGVALEFKIQKSNSQPKFLLAHLEADRKASTITLQNTLKTLARPIDLWLVNFHAPVEVNNCIADDRSLASVNGYEYELFHCR